MLRRPSLFLFLFLVTFITGCGQTGPLYLPGTKPPIYVPHPHHIQQH